MPHSNNLKVYVLGTGQLGAMLQEAAKDLELDLELLPIDFDRAKSNIQNTDSQSQQASSSLNKTIFTFENEFIDVATWKNSVFSNLFHPSLDCLQVFQDKTLQKSWLISEGFQVLPSISFETFEQLNTWLKVRPKEYQNCILKWSKFGYDGYGNFAIDNDLLKDKQVLSSLKIWAEKAYSRNAVIFAEPQISFIGEMALQIPVAENTNPLTFPPVWTVQKKGICRFVMGPLQTWPIETQNEYTSYTSNIKSSDLSKPLEQIATSLQKSALNWGYRGLLSCEMFLARDGKVWINELAPRVHNSGHHTRLTATLNQFHWHLLCLLPEETRVRMQQSIFEKDQRTRLSQNFADVVQDPFLMINLIGGSIDVDLFKEAATYANKLQTEGVDTDLKWYNKEPRPGRKLGHLSLQSSDLEKLRKAMVNSRCFGRG